MKVLLISCILLIPAIGIGQKLDAFSIPDTLFKGANIVTRFEETVYEIKSPAKAVVHERHVYTILNEAGDYIASYGSPYGKFISINNISGYLYNSMGKELKHVKKKDMEDVGGTSEESLITDRRFKINHFYYHEYPYTVDYEEEDEINGIVDFNDWIPQGINRASVEDTRFVVIAPKEYVLRYKPVNCSFEPVITTNGDKKIYTWELKNLPARGYEELSPTTMEIIPYVLIGPSDFEVEGYKGNMNTWKNYGRFLYELARNRDVLPEDVKHKVHELTDRISEPKDKIRVLYEFLQKNTRYISIQLGIGGWQPFDANYVATKGYGDCKALSNYMVALLKEAGITGKLVVIRSGEHASPINNNFPKVQFNHQIACVPLKNDTVWLECTDHELPAGYLSGFTSNRWALLFDENGGTLVHTPKYGVNDNLQSRKIKAVLNETGDLKVSSHTMCRGEKGDELFLDLEYTNKEQQKDKLKSKIDLPTYDVNDFGYKEVKNVFPPYIEESLELTVNNYAQVSGKRIFIMPNVLTHSRKKMKQEEDRKFIIKLSDEFREIDSVEITIPEGYQPESVPQAVELKTPYGSYKSNILILAAKIIYYRKFEQFSGYFPTAEYKAVAKFYDQVYKADLSKVVFRKKE